MVNDLRYSKALLEDAIHGKKTMNFAEIVNLLRLNRMEVTGDCTWRHEGSNVVFWIGMSDTLSDSLKELMDEGKIRMVMTTPEVYYAEGMYLDLPIAKKPPRKGYVKEHWMPVVFELKENNRIDL